MKLSYIIGIDEVGRGPLAGPVAVCALILKQSLPKGFKRKNNTFDSKKISSKEREFWYEKICMAQKSGYLDFKVTFISEKNIDTKGLSFAIRSALEKSLRGVIKKTKLFSHKYDVRFLDVRLDGGLKAPKEFPHQKTIIKGDAKETVIGLASIVAKVQRDRKMEALHKKYPLYSFNVHKGYGTLAHRQAILKYGPSPVHRKSFLRSLL